MPYTDAMAEADFIADPVDFMSNHIVRTVLYDGPASMPNRVSRLSLTKDNNATVKKDSYHWYSRSTNFYRLTTDPAGNIYAYVLGYKDDDAVGVGLGIEPTTNANPALMVTYRMDGCSLGYSQAAGGSAYVSHHNDKIGSNVAATMQGQAITWNPAALPAAAPAQNFMHKATYMAASDGNIHIRYKATIIGVRSAAGVWRFYYQARKRKANTGADMNKWSLKGMTAI